VSPAGGSLELLSLHWMHAERFDRAWTYSRQAGDRARALWANADAVSFYDRALRAAAHLRLPAAEVLAVAEALGDTSEVAAHYERARRAYGRARRLCRGDDDRARLLRKGGVLYERQGRYREALNCYTRGRKLVEGGGPPAARERCELSLAAAGVKERQGRYRESLIDAERAGREAEEAGHLPGLAHSLYLQQMISDYLGAPADELGRRSLAIYEDLGDLVGQGNALNNLGISAYYAGRWGEALDFYERSREARVRSGDVVGAATAENNIAEILSDQGELDQARLLLESARATWAATGYRIGAAFATSNLGRLRARHGDIDAARRLLAEALEEFTAIKSSGSAAETRLRLRECDVLAGEFAAAAQSLDVLLDQVRGKPGYEQIEMSALRLLAVAGALAGGPAVGGPAGYLEAAVEKARALDNPYELALSLATRSVLSGHGFLDGGAPGMEGDGPRAAEIFAGLGVRQAVITWSTEVTGAPLFAYRAG
jgi:tetratricopeptide (TPR) repeat protein